MRDSSQEPVAGKLGGYPAGGECAGLERAVHRVTGAGHPGAGAPVASGAVGDHLGGVQTREGEFGS
jgi:hypothetical protein